MNNSNNSALEEGIREVERLSNQISTLAEQEAAFKGVATSLSKLQVNLNAIWTELQKLDCARERRRWTLLWLSIGGLAALQVLTLILLFSKS